MGPEPPRQGQQRRRVLVVSGPMLGHVLPLVPVAAASREAGHDVLVASAGDALRADTVGLAVHDVAPGFRFERVGGLALLGHPVLLRRELAGRAGTSAVGRLFGAVNEKLTDGVVALARDWHADLVIHEPLAVAGAVAAARLGIPAVLHENSLWSGAELVAATVDSARTRRALRRHGIGHLPSPAATVRIAPASVVGRPTGDPVRAAGYSGTGDAPEWLLQPSSRARVLVSRSTVRGPGGGDPTGAVVAAAENVDAEFVLVRPPGAVLMRPLPANVRTVGWTPLAAALQHAAAFVHHGGAGSVLGGLAAGVPQLAVPGPGDRRHNADLLARRGAGLAIEAKEITAHSINRLIGDTDLRAAAAEVRAEIAAMPPPSQLVRQLATLF